MELVLITIYAVALFLILVYSLNHLNLLFNYIGAKRNQKKLPQLDLGQGKELPIVTVQFPVFNELYVIERLLDTIPKLKYPKDRLEVQVLDDSTDESIEVTKAKVKEIQELGYDIKYIHRTNRQGFKAGALKEGMKSAEGEYVAIFDADFLPQEDFLINTLPYFQDEEVGLVQTRWSHINRDYSLLTKIQAFALDAHFTIEQVGRNAKNHFINFNGTAGIWRKACIEDAGNWKSDTLTEDLDLSYRSQLKGWKFKYLEDVETPAELPIIISAARSQQFRWNKGGAENFRRMKKRVLLSNTIPLKTKFHGMMHLLNSTMFLNIFLVAFLSIPMLYIKFSRPEYGIFFKITSGFVLSTAIFFVCYWFMYKKLYGKGLKNFLIYIKDFTFFFTVAMGFSLQNSVAVIEGHIGKRSSFVRTPKFNIEKFAGGWKANKYIQTKLTLVNWIEGLMMLYFLFGIYSAFVLTDFGLLPFHVMLFFGFGFVFYKSITCKA